MGFNANTTRQLMAKAYSKPFNISLFWYYIKQIMNVFIRAMVRTFSFGERWNVPFNSAVASLNGTFHLSPHENILTIALINIHYLYNITWILTLSRCQPAPQPVLSCRTNSFFIDICGKIFLIFTWLKNVNTRFTYAKTLKAYILNFRTPHETWPSRKAVWLVNS